MTDTIETKKAEKVMTEKENIRYVINGEFYSIKMNGRFKKARKEGIIKNYGIVTLEIEHNDVFGDRASVLK